MRDFTIEQYKRMALKFNKMDFAEKLKCLNENSDILTLANDHNWWGVRPIDKKVRESLEEQDIYFDIEREWSDKEVTALLGLTKITQSGLTD